MSPNNDGVARKLALQMGLSLDGLVARPGRYRAGGLPLAIVSPALSSHAPRFML